MMQRSRLAAIPRGVWVLGFVSLFSGALSDCTRRRKPVVIAGCGLVARRDAVRALGRH